VPLDGTTVLIVDDDADSVEILGYVVSDARASVRTATSGREALEILAGWKPQVLLLDVDMPLMNGYQLLGAIRSNPELRDIPAVAITGRSCPSDKQQAFEAGFSVHIAKPFEAEALIDLVEWLASRPARRTRGGRGGQSGGPLPPSSVSLP
jgi:CheY-like chemotaxis protein